MDIYRRSIRFTSRRLTCGELECPGELEQSLQYVHHPRPQVLCEQGALAGRQLQVPGAQQQASHLYATTDLGLL
jgi:hypothetical protein